MSKPWRIQAREDYFVILGANGDEMLQSVKEYASPASAKRAAENAFEALTSAEVTLEVLDEDGETQQLASSGGSRASAPSPVEDGKTKGGEKISVVEPGKSRHASSPYAQ